MLEMLRHDFLRHALAAAIVAGVSLSFVGVYVILRRIVFVGAALAQLGAAGVGLALLTGFSPLLGGAVGVFAGVFGFVLMPQQEKAVSRESLLGAAYAIASAFALLFVALSPVGEAHITSLLFGDLLAVGHGDMELLAAACLFVIFVHLIAYHAFVAVTVDPTFAHSVGIRERTVNLLFYLSLGALIGACIRAIGALVVFAFLVLPPIAGLVSARSLKVAFAVAITIAAFSAVFGLWLSFAHDLPAGPSVVAVCGAMTFLVAMSKWAFALKPQTKLNGRA